MALTVEISRDTFDWVAMLVQVVAAGAAAFAAFFARRTVLAAESERRDAQEAREREQDRHERDLRVERIGRIGETLGEIIALAFMNLSNQTQLEGKREQLRVQFSALPSAERERLSAVEALLDDRLLDPDRARAASKELADQLRDWGDES